MLASSDRSEENHYTPTCENVITQVEHPAKLHLTLLKGAAGILSGSGRGLTPYCSEESRECRRARSEP